MPPLDELYDGSPNDPREDPRIIKGWKIDEILPGDAPLNWRKKSEAELDTYPVWTQGSSSACVAYSKARQIAVRVKKLTGLWVDYSPSSIYQLRANKPRGGMDIADANSIVDKRGVALEAYMRSFGLNEAGINSTPRSPVAELSAKANAEAVAKYFYFNGINIDRIAQALENGKAVSLLMFSSADEYARAIPLVKENITYETASIRHEVLAVDYLLDSKGKKMLRIEDSAHFGGFNKRFFTEDFLVKRTVMADTIEVFNLAATVPVSNRPVYTGNIISLQTCLKYEGLFPQSVGVVENFGPVTQRSVKMFQEKYDLPLVNAITSDVRAKLFALYPMPPAAGPVDNDDVPSLPYTGI